MADIYTGRLACDGDGNLLADDGQPVAHNTATGQYEYVEEGGPSHNERHHQNHVTVEATLDALYNKAGELVTDPPPPHHFEPTEDDPHYEPAARNKTLIRDDPDDIAPTTSSHTGAYV